MTKTEAKPLLNIDASALVRTISHELEYWKSNRVVTRYEEREIPSFDTAKTVELEGGNLSKVNRYCKTGDFVRFSGKRIPFITQGKFYEVHEKQAFAGWFIDDDDNERFIRSTVNMNDLDFEVFEVFEAASDVASWEIKSPNQQHAELIQWARMIVDKYTRYMSLVFKFEVDVENHTILAQLTGSFTRRVQAQSISKCPPGKVFNADIGKLISMFKILQIDIPREFTDAVQPRKELKKWTQQMLTDQ